MNNIAAGFIFIAGVAVGAVGGVVLTKAKYEQIAQDEINEAREFYNQQKKEEKKEAENVQKIANDLTKGTALDMSQVVSVPKAVIRNNPDLKKVAKEIMKEEGYDSREEGPQDDDPEEDDDEEEDMIEEMSIRERQSLDKPKVISPAEYGEMDSFEQLEFTLYADGILTDDRGFLVEDPEEVLGPDALESFGEYEEDSVYVVNEGRRTYYAVLKDIRNYRELPKRMRRG